MPQTGPFACAHDIEAPAPPTTRSASGTWDVARRLSRLLESPNFPNLGLSGFDHPTASGHGLPCPRVSRKWVAGIEELRVRRLTAGGEWIRTIGSAPNSQPFRALVGDRADRPSARWCTRAVAGLGKSVDPWAAIRRVIAHRQTCGSPGLRCRRCGSIADWKLESIQFQGNDPFPGLCACARRIRAAFSKLA